MKKLSHISGLLFFIVLLNSCGPSTATKPATNTIIEEKQGFYNELAPRMDYDHLVVRYPPNWTKERKEKFKDSLHLIKNPVKTCPCGDTNLEFLAWDKENFPNLDIQSAKNGLTGGPGKPQGDQPFTYTIPLLVDEEAYNLTTLAEVGEFKAQIAGLTGSLLATDLKGSAANIVVIDTGIDFYKNRDMAPFLYNTNNLSDECGKQNSGWNFVGKDEDVTDKQGHGTYVTRLITSELEKNNVPYRILPVKAFNSNGEGKYWDIVCALSYVKKVQATNKNLHVINTSFGYSFFESLISEDDRNKYAKNSIVKELIESLSKDALVIASAGNVGNNTNISGNENYPASFSSKNIIGVGGYIQNNQNKELAGNFGNISIDVAAPYSNYNYTFKNENGDVIENVELIGSSYSAAYTTAKMAQLIHNLQQPATPIENKNNFLDPTKISVQIDPSLDYGISNGRYQEE